MGKMVKDIVGKHGWILSHTDIYYMKLTHKKGDLNFICESLFLGKGLEQLFQCKILLLVATEM